MHKPNSIFEAARQVLSEGNSPTVNSKAVAAFQKAIDKHHWKRPKNSDNTDDTDNMVKKYTADRADLQRILNLYKEGKWALAYKLVAQLDTSVREEIPGPIFDELSEA